MTGVLKNVSIPYGKGSIKFKIPVKRLFGILKNDHGKKRPLSCLIIDALDAPLGKNTLENITRGKKNVLIVVPDHTRKAHLMAVLPEITKRVSGKGRAITIIVATGLHTPPGRQSLKELIGADMLKKCDVICHSQKRSSLVDLGCTPSGVPIVLNSVIKKHDAVISVGVIEPHLYAGYSGGFKTVAIGLAGEKTINVTHGVKFLGDGRTRIGSINGNPFQDALRDIASAVKIDFSVNVVNDSSGKAAGVFAGDTAIVFKKGVAASGRLFEIKARKKADIVICGIGYPKDINLYQASRAINYIVNTEDPVVKKSGVIIVAAELKEGAGTSPAEKRFHRTLKRMGPAKKFIESVNGNDCLVGEHRTYMVAKAMCEYRVLFVSKCDGAIFNGLAIPCFKDMARALRHAKRHAGEGAGIYVVPHTLSTIATV
jgi:nickel-dependent lactate racemase